MIKYVLICLFVTSCTGRPFQDSIKSKDILCIKIFNYTYNRKLPNKIELIDGPSIEQVVREINYTEPIRNTSNLKASLGYYDVQLN